MLQVVIDRPGLHDRLVVHERPDPIAGPGEVRVRVRAIGVNYADCIVRMGLYASAREYVGWPITPGFEVSGEVDAIGDGVDPSLLGAEVIALTRFGGYASAVVVPAHQVFRAPTGLDLVRAAGVPAVFLTAYYALFELAHPRPGSTILVHSAAGGVGSALLQLARVAGCEAVAVVGASHKVAAAAALGAKAVIDKSREDLWAAAERHAPGGYQVICDANGVSTLGQSYRHLAPTGKLVIYGFHSMLPRSGRVRWLRLAFDWLRTPRFNPLRLTNENRSVLAFNLSYLFDAREVLGEAMAKILGWIAAGEVTLPAVTTYPLRQVADAQRALESGQTVGKLVLVP
ncbi:MAG: medium chain dehydrogenase/reductase family protein [Nannocystaceae bacterium]